MRTDAHDLERYENMLLETDKPWCWACGRSDRERPTWWYGPWLIERAHFVNKPRAKDRRAVVLLCSLCHKISHGAHFPRLGPQPPLTTANLIWLKQRHDPEYYDPEFTRRHSVRIPPAPAEPDVPWAVARSGQR